MPRLVARYCFSFVFLLVPQSESADLRRELDRLRNDLSLMRLDRDDQQESHVKQLEGLFQEVSELNRFVRLSYTDPESEVVRARGIAHPDALAEKSEELLTALEEVQVHERVRVEAGAGGRHRGGHRGARACASEARGERAARSDARRRVRAGRRRSPPEDEKRARGFQTVAVW